MKKLLLPLLLTACLSSPALARDDALKMSFQDLLDSPEAKEKLDGSVKFYLAGAHTPKILQKLGSDQSNKKTNSVGKAPETSCQRAALSALLAFQSKAKQLGANAVVELASYYKSIEFKSTTEYECHDGNIMSGVAFKGTYAKVP
jgi:uncharacterized protein YbjQ (UPF0145 family)